MKKQPRTRIFHNDSRGSMLLELLLSVALAALVIPFVFRYQTDAVRRAENIAVTRQMQGVQSALERYIVANREELLKSVGRNITRLKLSDLVEYGVSPDLVAARADRYQLRILKSADYAGQATLQGVVVLSDDDITPLRTREIVALGGDRMGFLDGRRAHGTFGAWHADTVDLGLNLDAGIVETTAVNRDNALYLSRVPTDNAADATMLSALNLGGHDVVDATDVNASSARFDETLKIGETAATTVIFDRRTTIDKTLRTQNATVSGTMSSDAKAMNVSGVFSLADLGKFSAFNTGDLWATNLTLSGLSISSDVDGPVTINVNQALDMTAGRVDAIYVTVGFTGSVTPRLVVRDRIEDSINSAYFWDVAGRTANFSDVLLAELTRMAPLAVRMTRGSDTVAFQTFSAVAANKNATAADYMNAISEIQRRVREKYRRLNLN